MDCLSGTKGMEDQPYLLKVLVKLPLGTNLSEKIGCCCWTGGVMEEGAVKTGDCELKVTVKGLVLLWTGLNWSTLKGISGGL